MRIGRFGPFGGDLLAYSINQSISLYFRHWAHRTVKNIKNSTVKRQESPCRLMGMKWAKVY